MTKLLSKIPPSLLVLTALAIWRMISESDGPSSILGTRTMKAIEDFKSELQPTADDVEKNIGISARLGVVQAALESGYGNSDLSRKSANLEIMAQGKVVGHGPALNIFGFKTGQAWIDAGNIYVLLPTVDYYKAGQKMPNGEVAVKDGQALKWPAPFRAYHSWGESYRDWARLMGTPGYVADGALVALKEDDLQAFGDALSKRYAPNQDYAKRLSDRADAMGLA